MKDLENHVAGAPASQGGLRSSTAAPRGITVEFDGRFTVTYSVGDEHSAIRVLPEFGRLIAAAPDLLEAAQLLEAAELGRQDCDECDGGEGEPEACGKCFPSFDDARIKRRLAITKATGA